VKIIKSRPLALVAVARIACYVPPDFWIGGLFTVAYPSYFPRAVRPFRVWSANNPQPQAGLAGGAKTHRTDDLVADDSKTTDVGARYALALFGLAKDSSALAAIEADLKALKAMLAESADLRRLLPSPIFKSDIKGKVLLALADKAEFGDITKKFLGFLAQSQRTAALASIITAFEALSAAERGVVTAEVVTAVKMTAAQAKSVAAALQQALGKAPEIETRIDPALLGGIKVRVGSRLFDASLRSKLDSLKFALKRA
jgi:F-type H+-transporting ATPase subunit delta